MNLQLKAYHHDTTFLKEHITDHNIEPIAHWLPVHIWTIFCPFKFYSKSVAFFMIYDCNFGNKFNWFLINLTRTFRENFDPIAVESLAVEPIFNFLDFFLL